MTGSDMSGIISDRFIILVYKMDSFHNSVLKSPADVQSLLMDVLVKRTDPRIAMALMSNYANEHAPTNGEITISRFTPLTEYIGSDGTVYYNRTELIKKL